MSTSISNTLSSSSAATASTAPSEALMAQLRALPAGDRENVLQSLAEKRPGFVSRIRQLLAQDPATDDSAGATDGDQDDPLAQAAQASQAAQFDPLQWMQGAQGLSLLDFLAPSQSAQGTGMPPSDIPQAPEDFQSQNALSSYLSNKFTL